MEIIRNIIREEIEIVINSNDSNDSNDSDHIDFGPSLGRTMDTLIEIQDTYNEVLSDSDKLKKIEQILRKFF